jgi:hypothetical protein
LGGRRGISIGREKQSFFEVQQVNLRPVITFARENKRGIGVIGFLFSQTV